MRRLPTTTQAKTIIDINEIKNKKTIWSRIGEDWCDFLRWIIENLPRKLNLKREKTDYCRSLSILSLLVLVFFYFFFFRRMWWEVLLGVKSDLMSDGCAFLCSYSFDFILDDDKVYILRDCFWQILLFCRAAAGASAAIEKYVKTAQGCYDG